MEKFCKRVDTWDYKYVDFYPLSEMSPKIQPEGYLVRLPFYIVGRRNAHILLSPDEHPNERKTDVYEIGEFYLCFS